ncbi:MAG: preprotein translocase subunit SecE [Armatimonadetes bacterium]|nr:preprotein translocase subunit SecE [Armatimonadota bacterium]
MSGERTPLPDIKGRGISGFYRDVTREMKHVTWPTRQEAIRLTGVVLGVCGMLALILTAASWVLEMGLKLLQIGGK